MHPLFNMPAVLRLGDEDYNHKDKTGNIGDLTKHLFLSTLLAFMFQQRSASVPFTYLDTHGGWSASQHGRVTEAKINSLRGVNPASSYIYATNEWKATGKYLSSWEQVSVLAKRMGVYMRMNVMDIVSPVCDENRKRQSIMFDNGRKVQDVKWICGSGWMEASISKGSYDFIFVDPPYKDFGGGSKGKTTGRPKIAEDWLRTRALVQEFIDRGQRGLVWMPYNTDNTVKKAGLPGVPYVVMYDAQILPPYANTESRLNRVIKGSGFYVTGFSLDELQMVIQTIQADPAFVLLGNRMKIELR